MPGDEALKHEENRRKEDEIWDQMREGALLAMRQENASKQSSYETDWNKGSKPRPHFLYIASEAIDTPRRSNHQRERACGIGNNWGHTKENEHREGHQCTTACNGIDHAGRTGRKKKSNDFNG
jgi:hypothetical protein